MVCAGCEGGNARTPQFLCLPHAHKGARMLCGLGTWVGGWVGGCQTPPPPGGGVGHLSVCGYAKILGGWVPELTPPPPRVAKQNPGRGRTTGGHASRTGNRRGGRWCRCCGNRDPHRRNRMCTETCLLCGGEWSECSVERVKGSASPPPPSHSREEEEGHRAVRSRWAPPPMEGKGPREGQRMAMGQYAPPAADKIITPKASCQSPPPISQPVAAGDDGPHIPTGLPSRALPLLVPLGAAAPPLSSLPPDALPMPVTPPPPPITCAGMPSAGSGRGGTPSLHSPPSLDWHRMACATVGCSWTTSGKAACAGTA